MGQYLRNRKKVLLWTAALSILSFLTALFQKGQTASLILLLVTLAFAGAAAWNQAERTDFADCHRSNTLTLLLLPAACAMAAAGLITMLVRRAWLLGAAELVAGLSVAVHGWTILGGKAAKGPVYGFMTAASVVRLIILFRIWDITPSIASYYRPLFAGIAFLLYASLLMVSTISMGRRRNQVFFAVFGAVLSAAAVPGELISEVLFHLGATLFFFSEISSLLGKRRRRRSPLDGREEAEPAAGEPQND